MAGRYAKINHRTEEVISYLPLSHVAAQILDIHIPMLYTATVYFAQPDALKVSIILFSDVMLANPLAQSFRKPRVSRLHRTVWIEAPRCGFATKFKNEF